MTRKQRAGRWTAAGFLMLFVAATGSASTPTDADLQQEIEHRLEDRPRRTPSASSSSSASEAFPVDRPKRKAPAGGIGWPD